MERLVVLLALLLCAIPGCRATNSLTQSNSAETNNVTSQTCTMSSTLAAGDLILVYVRLGGAGTITATDGPGTTYAHVTASPLSDSSSNQIALLWGILSAGQSSVTVTASQTGSASRFTVACFDYHSTTGWQASAVDTSGHSANASSSSGVSGTITPAAAGELIFAGIELVTGPTANSQSVNSPFTIQIANGSATSFDSNSRTWGADDQNASGSNHTATFTWTTNSASAAIIAAFKPAGGGATPKCGSYVSMTGVGCA